MQQQILPPTTMHIRDNISSMLSNLACPVQEIIGLKLSYSLFDITMGSYESVKSCKHVGSFFDTTLLRNAGSGLHYIEARA